MIESANSEKLRDGLRAIRVELEELMNVLSAGERAPGRACEPSAQSAEIRPDFFDELTRDQSPIDAELYLKVLKIITSLGYASTLVLQHRLELNFRQATTVVAELERDGLVGPAHGFRPHKTLPSAYVLLERLEEEMEIQKV